MKLANLNRNGEESQPQPLRELTVEDVAMLPAAASTATAAITAAAAPAIRTTVVAATSSDGRDVGGMAAMKHIDTMQRQAEPDAGGLRQLGPEACRQIAAGALTALGTNFLQHVRLPADGCPDRAARVTDPVRAAHRLLNVGWGWGGRSHLTIVGQSIRELP